MSLPRAVLVPNLIGFPSMSMQRHATELEAALRRVGAGEWAFETLSCDGQAGWMQPLPGPARRRLAGLNGRWRAYPKVVAGTKGEVYHIFDHSHATLADAAPAGKAIVTCHDIIPLLAARGVVDVPVKPWIRYTFLKRLDAMRRCRWITTVSESTRNDLIRHAGFDPERIQVIWNGVEPRFCPEPPAPLTREAERAGILAGHGIPGDARMLLHVGTRNRYKNTPAVLQTLARVRSAREDVWLVRIGAPFFEDESALIETLGIRDRVVHAGRVSDEALVAHYRAADVFVFPSLYEGFGWPPLEAMACGTPVVASCAASLPEVVGDAGITCGPHDHDGLAAATLALLGDETRRRRLARAGLERAATFGWDRCARETLALYARVWNNGQ